MGLIDLASYESAWRGYEYYKENKVLSVNEINENEYEGMVSGSRKEPYSVYLNIAHAKKSKCDCPFAENNMKVCKHKVAVYFTLFPDEAEEYYKEVVRAETEAIEYQKEINELVTQKIQKMKKNELQQALYEVLMDGPQWLFDRFVDEYIER